MNVNRRRNRKDNRLGREMRCVRKDLSQDRNRDWNREDRSQDWNRDWNVLCRGQDRIPVCSVSFKKKELKPESDSESRIQCRISDGRWLLCLNTYKRL